MNKNTKTLKRLSFLFYLCAFLISAAGMLLILKSRGFYPFKDATLFTSDMKDQYVGFYASLRYLFGRDNSPFLSWSRSLGGNYIGLYAYYMGSPLSFLTVCFPIEKLPLAFVVLTVVKIGLCGLSFAIFSSYLWNRNLLQNHPVWSNTVVGSWKQFLLLPLAVSYALISYNMVYALCIMWLDGVMLLPLILLGIEKMLDGKKGFFYLLSLTALFFFNYYTGYMVGIFTALYVLFRCFTQITKANKKQSFTFLLRFTINSLLAIGLSTPLLLPVIRDLQNGKLTDEFCFPERNTNFAFLQLFGRLTNGAYDTITTLGKPSIYCGYLVLFLVVLFFLHKKIALREKAGAGILLLFLALSFYITKLDVAWHCFQEPNFFPNRYAFVCSFFLIYLATRVVCQLPFDRLPTIWEKKPLFEILVAAMMLFVAIDLGINGRQLLLGIGNEFGYSKVEDYETFLSSSKPLLDSIQQEDSDFYRINQHFEYSKNDAMLLGYHGLTHYSSTYNQAVNDFTRSLGMAQAWIWNSGYGSTPLSDSILASRYVLSDKELPDTYVKLKETNQDTASYYNEGALSLVYSAPASTLTPDLSSVDPFVNQNNLLNSMAGTDCNYFTEYPYTTEPMGIAWIYRFTANSSNPVYLYMKSRDFSLTDVYVNDKLMGNYFTTETNCNLYLGSFTAGEEVTVKVIPNAPITVDFAAIAQLHTDMLQESLATLQENPIQFKQHKNGKLEGTIYVPENQVILTSIPYEESWTVKIDGQKAVTGKFADTFLAIETNAGEHSISFSYVSPGIYTGILVFFITLLLSIAYYKYPLTTLKGQSPR